MLRASVYDLGRPEGHRFICRLDDMSEEQAAVTMEHNYARNGYGFLAVIAQERSVGHEVPAA